MHLHRQLLFSLTILLTLVSNAPATQPPPGFQPLFDGQSLQGWYGNNPHTLAKLTGEKKQAALQQMKQEFASHWRIEHGELVNDGTGPYATTAQDYGDIELMLEYKTVPLADSGIYLRGSPHIQIWDTTHAGGKWNLNADKGSGGLYNNSPQTPGQLPLVHADKHFGQWNSLRIKQIGDKTSVWLNDQLVVDQAIMENYWDRTQPLPPTGPIMLQTHGGEIRWRNIWIKILN